MVSRLERTPFAAWWWTIDRLLLAALLALMLGGIVLSLAASPPVASRLGLEPFYFVEPPRALPDPRARRPARRPRSCRPATSAGSR